MAGPRPQRSSGLAVIRTAARSAAQTAAVTAGRLTSHARMRPAFLIAGLVMSGLVLATLRSLRRREAALAALEAARR